MKKKINKNMTFTEVMEINSEAGELLFSKGLGCAMCHGASFETIEQGCKIHGMTDKQIDKLIEELNEKVNK